MNIWSEDLCVHGRQDNGEETGLLHISLSFASSGGGIPPQVITFDLSSLLTELGGGGAIAASFAIPGDEGKMQTYLRRIVTDASVNHPDFGSDLSLSYFELSIPKWEPSVTIDGSELAVRINLSTKHGRYLAKIEVLSQNGLEVIGMDNPQDEKGADTSYSGGGGPKFKGYVGDDDKDENRFFNHVLTAMIDIAVEAAPNEELVIDSFNRRFNCVDSDGLDVSPIECFISSIDSIVVTPVYPTFNGTSKEPDLVNGERANANRTTMKDLKREQRLKPVAAVGNRSTIVTKIAPKSIADPNRPSRSAATLAHELGHGLLRLPDLYSGGRYREQVQYVGNHCIMRSSSSFSHFCAYNKRVVGWLEDDAIVVIDRPTEDNPINNKEVVLFQLEHWDPLLDEDERNEIVKNLLSGMTEGTPVKAAVFLRLGGDGRQFNILELRGKGVRFSSKLTTSRVIATNAIDPEDDTRYAENEVEGAGTTKNVLERYRRKVHLLTKDLQAVGDSFDFASDPTFPEVGLTVTVLEWATGTTTAGNSFDLARISIDWDRGPAIDLGFNGTDLSKV